MAEITVFRNPGFNGPSGLITAGGELWFTNIGDHRVGRIRDGAVELFADPRSSVRLPANIFPGSDGRVWFTSLGSDSLGAIDPTADDPASTITTYALPAGSRPVALKSDPDGRLWFSMRGNDSIGSLDPREPEASLRVVQEPGVAGPAALFVTPTGQVWWVNSTTNTLGFFKPDGLGSKGSVVDDLPASPRAWAQTTDGRLWLTTREPAGLLCFDPADPAATAVHVTDPRVREPDGVWIGADGAVWFADTGANAIGRYEPDTGTWDLHGGPPEVDGPFDIKTGPDGALWFTNKAGNSIGRIDVLHT